MKHMLDYDFVVSACSDEGGDGQPGECIRGCDDTTWIFIPRGNRREASAD